MTGAIRRKAPPVDRLAGLDWLDAVPIWADANVIETPRHFVHGGDPDAYLARLRAASPEHADRVLAYTTDPAFRVRVDALLDPSEEARCRAATH